MDKKRSGRGRKYQRSLALIMVILLTLSSWSIKVSATESSGTETSTETIDSAAGSETSTTPSKLSAAGSDNRTTASKISTASSDASTAEGEISSQDAAEGQEIEDCLEISALIAETWDDDYFGTIVLDANAGEAEVDGETEDISDICDYYTEADDGNLSEGDAEEVLTEYLDTLPEDSDLYTVEECDDGAYEITAPFQTKRLIVEAEALDDTYGAAQIYYNTEMGETILQFDTMEDTKEAYEELCLLYGSEDCYPDVVFAIDDITEATSSGTSSYSWGTAYMGMDTLKAEAEGKYGTVTVAILDTGIDKSNQLFQSRKISSKSYNFIGNNKNVTDKNGHGTHVAGIIADATPSNVRLMMLKITSSDGYSSLLTVKTALQYALKQDICVINMSIGFISASASSCTYLNSLINKAYRKGIPIVTAAGNSAINVSYCYPACNKKTIAVSALDQDGVIASYSNVGSRIDFCAPGTAIVSAKAGGKLVSMTGTSMAAPHITAAVTYLKMMQSNLSVTGVYNELKLLSVDLGSSGKDNYYGWGCPNLANLLTKGITYTSDVVTSGLTTPVIKSVKNSENGIKITWKKVSNAKKYYLYRKTGNGSYKRIKIIT
ncbi:MAG: S8 family serine peptidase, partial [Clostridiales bacterium]|nr:S8 family serine peptidase [Clostridiales bacterium]